MSLAAVLGLGFFLGIRHATDADHVLAVTTIVSRARSIGAAARVGALWGLGHTATILLVGGAIILFGLTIPPRLGLSMELCVAVMLVVLGLLNVTQRARSARAPEHESTHPDRRLRPLLVGLVHGLAGSAAVALLVLTSVRDAGWALLYLLVFGLGTVGGMVLLTSAIAIPATVTAERFQSFQRTLVRLTGAASVAFGLFLFYQIGFVDGLFSGSPSWDPH